MQVYYSSVSCGYSVSEAVAFAPSDWLLLGCKRYKVRVFLSPAPPPSRLSFFSIGHFKVARVTGWFCVELQCGTILGRVSLLSFVFSRLHRKRGQKRPCTAHNADPVSKWPIRVLSLSLLLVLLGKQLLSLTKCSFIHFSSYDFEMVASFTSV